MVLRRTAADHVERLHHWSWAERWEEERETGGGVAPPPLGECCVIVRRTSLPPTADVNTFSVPLPAWFLLHTSAPLPMKFLFMFFFHYFVGIERQNKFGREPMGDKLDP